jgi:protein SCO1
MSDETGMIVTRHEPGQPSGTGNFLPAASMCTPTRRRSTRSPLRTYPAIRRFAGWAPALECCLAAEVGGCARMKAMVRCWPVRLAGALAASVLAATGCGGGPGVPSPPSAYLGAVLDRTVPNGVANLPLITDAGKPTSLAALHGQIVVLADFLTLCQETCPLTTGNLLVMDRAVTAAGLGGRVRFVELTVDPDRDTPWRLRAYRRLVEAPPNLLLLTGSPAVIRQIWSYFGVWYQQVAEDDPPGTDWLTGKPLTYDVTHQDALIYLDGQGRERFLVAGSPDAAGAPIPLALRRFLSAQGQTDLNHPNASTWTAAEAVSPIAWLTGQPIHLRAS